MRRWFLLAGLALAAPAAAQAPSLSGAIAAGEVGERYDGYMGFVVAPPVAVRRQLDAVNIHRRNLYIELSERRNVTPQAVGLATACQLFSQLPVGEAYMLSDGNWRRRMPGQPPPKLDYCAH